MAQLRDHLGRPVTLAAKPFAVGGEGAVYDIQGQPDFVAKIYNKPQNRERCEKLRSMAQLCSPDLLRIAAWPTATLHKNGATVDGILMPRISGCLEIHHLYSVAQRKKDFPEVDWGFLLHTARNCAIAFESVHNHGHVVGDVNQKNVMVSKKGIVTLVDCDSFQVKEGNRIFRCGVGVPEYTPPELHGKNFGTLDREPNHDLFGLAVLIFHLLMMGRHPFSGVPTVQADIPIEKAIQGHLYAYSQNPTRLKPPPHVPPTSILDPAILDLFERAFIGRSRPTASQWKSTLDASMKQLTRCKNDSRHAFVASAGQCPWCRLIATAKLMYFLPGQGAAATFRPEDLLLLMQKFEALQIPPATYSRPKPAPVTVTLPPGLRPPTRKPNLASHPAPPNPQRQPAYKPHPPAPALPPYPNLRTLPLPPVYPPLPPPGPPDQFFPRLCLAGLAAGILVLFVAKPVGFVVMACFALWWIVLMATASKMQARERERLKVINDDERELIDEEYEAVCAEIREENKKRELAWQANVDVLQGKYDQACAAIDAVNRELKAAFDAAIAVKAREHERACKAIDETNARLIAAWEAENAVFIGEERRWMRQLAAARAELDRLEAELARQHASSLDQFGRKKRAVNEVTSGHHKVWQEFQAELRRAETGSRDIQLESYLDRFLIRDAKLKAITNERILSLESFGIETAKDVVALRTQKIPGIGVVLSDRLLTWRLSLERGFKPKQGLPESEKARIGGRFAPVMLPVEQALKAGVGDLEAITTTLRYRQQELVRAVGVAVQLVAESEAYLQALRSLN